MTTDDNLGLFYVRRGAVLEGRYVASPYRSFRATFETDSGFIIGRHEPIHDGQFILKNAAVLSQLGRIMRLEDFRYGPSWDRNKPRPRSFLRRDDRRMPPDCTEIDLCDGVVRGKESDIQRWADLSPFWWESELRQPWPYRSVWGYVRTDGFPEVNLKNASGVVLFKSDDTRVYAAVANAVLKDADLAGVVLRGEDLERVEIPRARLCGADLRQVNLQCADLRRADLRNADLGGADLRDADLRDADLRGARLDGAKLDGADLTGARGVTAPTSRATEPRERARDDGRDADAP